MNYQVSLDLKVGYTCNKWFLMSSRLVPDLAVAQMIRPFHITWHALNYSRRRIIEQR